MASRKSDRGAWFIAWALALALHAGAIFGFRSLPLLHSAPIRSREPEPIQLVFSRSSPQTHRKEQPHFFSELPSNRADAAPKNADFLSNVTSRARDRAPGGDAALPQMQGVNDAPMVKLEPHGSPPQPPASAPAPQPSAPVTPRPAESSQQSDAPHDLRSAGTGTPAPNPASVRPVGGATQQGPPGSVGNSDIDQPEMDNPAGNASLTGDVSLNTTAWDYAPWLQRYGRELMRRWVAPQAYYMGLLKEGGWAVIEVEITPSGKMLRADLLEDQGHPSLIQAAQIAVRNVAPIEPLPAGFPEPTLILRIRVVYPKYVPPERRRPPDSSRPGRPR